MRSLLKYLQKGMDACSNDHQPSPSYARSTNLAALALCLAAVAAGHPARAAARSVAVKFHNHTSVKLTLSATKLVPRYGQWVASAPAAVDANGDASWKSESSSPERGVGGSATFTASGFGSCTLAWSNPFKGISTYHWDAPAGYTVELHGGQGSDATIDFTLKPEPQNSVAPVNVAASRGSRKNIIDDLDKGYNTIVKGATDTFNSGTAGAKSAAGSISSGAQGVLDTVDNGAKGAGNTIANSVVSTSNTIAGGAVGAYNDVKAFALGVHLPLPDPFGLPRGDEDKFTPHASWMGDLAGTIGGYRLTEVIIPGTHDSGTYPITFLSDMSPYTYGEKAVDLAGHYEPGVVSNWARAQGLSVYNQLNAGARWLDVRPGWDANTGKLRTHHSMYGADFSDVLGQVKRFIDEQHREVVFLEISHIMGCSPSQEDALAAEIVSTIGANRLIAPRKRTGANSRDFPTFNSVWATQGRVVVIYSDRGQDTINKLADPIAKQYFWAGDNIVTNKMNYTPPSGAGPVETKKGGLDAYLTGQQWQMWWGGGYPATKPDWWPANEDYPPNPTFPKRTQFLSAGLTITPDTFLIEHGFIPTPADFANLLIPPDKRSSANDTPHSLEELARLDSPIMVGWLRTDWAGRRLNVFNADWIQFSGLIEEAIKRNSELAH